MVAKPKTHTADRTKKNAASSTMPKRRLPLLALNKPSLRKELRDTVTVITAVGTVLIGIGTLLVTSKVSGLEDYFHSEVNTKDAELRRTASDEERLSRQIDATKAAAVTLQLRLNDLAVNTAKQQTVYDDVERNVVNSERVLQEKTEELIKAELRERDTTERIAEMKRDGAQSRAVAESERADLEAVSRKLAGRVLPLIVRAHLLQRKKEEDNEISSATYMIVFDPSDVAFRNVSGGGVSSFLFFLADQSDVEKDGAKVADL